MVNFIANAYYSDVQYSCETSSLDTLMDFLLEHENTYFKVINRSTGKVLCYCNCPGEEDYLETDFMYLITGWMIMNQQFDF